MQIQIRPLELKDLPPLVPFCDREIGVGYYNIQDLQELWELSKLSDRTCSLVATSGDEYAGLRLTLAPGLWAEKIGRGLTTSAWKVPLEKTAYFKSLYINEKFQGEGLGGQLSGRSIEILREMGAQAIICHSWLESPNNSSQTYLGKMHFQPIREHPHFWGDIDYECTRCGVGRCVCTAVEMIRYL